ncbi:MAG: hypothetical protein ACLQPD_27070 [Desulfomonilaceae bacterium]
MVSRRTILGRVGVLQFVFVFALVGFAHSQGLQTSPYSAPSMLGSAEVPRESNSLYVSDRMLQGILPLIPNLQFGYLYDFGNKRVSQGRFTADYLLPFSLSRGSTVFGEAHTEFQSFWNTNSGFSGGFNNRVDISLGGGYRTFLRSNTLLGVNGFYDTSRLGGTWYSSGSAGLEMAALLPGNDAIDLNFNWYGQLFNSSVLVNAFRYGPSNFDFQAGYSHELWNGGPDLRLSATGYKFDIGNSVYGWNAGAELKSRDGMFVLKYAVGHDKVDKTYQTVGGFVNVGFRPENVLNGESPFVMPEPIFKSPRSLWYMLTQKVNRNWHQPEAMVVAQAFANAPPPTPGLYVVYGPAVISAAVPFATNPPIPPPAIWSSYTSFTMTWSGVTASSGVLNNINFGQIPTSMIPGGFNFNFIPTPLPTSGSFSSPLIGPPIYDTVGPIPQGDLLFNRGGAFLSITIGPGGWLAFQFM